MPDLVADASVIGAMVFGESRAEEAASLLGDDRLFGPTILGYEMAAIARKKILDEPDRREDLVNGLRTALDMNVQWREVDKLGVLQLALETGLTVYDASYLYVARSMGIELVTFDRRLRAAAAANG